MSLEHDLMLFERQYWDAIKNKDPKAAMTLSDDRCIVVGAQGAAEVDKPTLAKMLENGGWDLKEYSIDDVHVLQIAEGVAVVAYKVNEALVVDGKDVSLQAFDSSVWVRRDGGWVCALHTESLAGDPFGRDKA